MVTRQFKTVLTMAVLATAALGARPCYAIDYSATDGLANVQHSLALLQRQLETAKADLKIEVAYLQGLEQRIRDRYGLDMVPRELRMATERIDALDTLLIGFTARSDILHAQLVKIREDAVRHRDMEMVRKTELVMEQLAGFKSETKAASGDVRSLRDYIAYLYKLLGYMKVKG